MKQKKARWKMSSGLWWVAMPFVALPFSWLASGLSLAVLYFLHLPQVKDPDGFLTASPQEAYLSNFLCPVLFGLIWSAFAPYPRHVAAFFVGLSCLVPCSFCIYFDIERPIAYNLTFEIASFVAGTMVPVFAYLVLDRKDIKWL
jgi:hypothetical protein